MKKKSLLSSLLVVVVILGHFSFAQDSVKVTPAVPSASSISERLVGAWRLVSVETIRANGEIIYPFYGKHPQGILIYDRSGWMSVQIVSDPMPTVPAADSREEFLKATPIEKATAIDGFYSYYGTWSVDPSGSRVTHHIQQSLYPAERGEQGVRELHLDETRLVLTAKTHEMGEQHGRRLVWERIETPADKK